MREASEANAPDPAAVHAVLDPLLSRAARAQRKAERRAAAIEGDLKAIDDAQAWAARAPWLIAEAKKTPRGATSLRVSDWSTGEERFLEIALDPARTAHEQVEDIFAEARRLRRGREGVVGRLERARREIAILADATGELEMLREMAHESDERARQVVARVGEIEASLRAVLPKAIAPREKQPQVTRLPYREYVASGDLRVLVGRDAKSNDELTLHVAKPHHVWLHARGYPGSHVVACVLKGHSITSEQLVDCAHLAAHFSEARGEQTVEVSYLERRFVRKPRKSPPGAVMLEREKVLMLRVDEARLQALLREPEAPLPEVGLPPPTRAS